jgi:GGDEF domain-containing protein
MSTAKLPALSASAFARFFDDIPTAAAACNAMGTLLAVNRALALRFGSDPEVWLGRNFAELPLTPVGTSGDAHELYVSPMANGADVKISRKKVDIGDGVSIHYLEVYRPLAGDALHPLAAIGGRPQGIDRESGVLDRVSVAHVLQSEVARCRRYGNPLAIVLIALDASSGRGFEASDGACAPAVLGRLLVEQTRWADCVGRWSPDSYLLVLPETTLSAAQQLVSKVNAAIAQLMLDQLCISTRMAAEEWRQGDDARALLKRSEALLSAETQPASLVD